MGCISVSCKLAVTAFLVSTCLFELRELHNNDTRLGNRFRLRSFCGGGIEILGVHAFARLFLLQHELFRAKPLQMDDDLKRANPETFPNSPTVIG